MKAIVTKLWFILGSLLVHEDMKRAFAAYPQNWGLKRPDSSRKL